MTMLINPYAHGGDGGGGGGGSDYETEVLSDSPVAFWRLQETSGTSAADSSGNGHTATYTGDGVTLDQTGPLFEGSKAIGLAGTDDYVVPDVDSAAFDTDEVTVEAWIKLTGTGTYQVLSRDDSSGGTGRSFQFRIASGKAQFIAFAGGSTGQATSTTSVNDGAWHHVVGSFGHGFVRIFVDGLGESAVAKSGTLDPGAQPVIGVRGVGTLSDDYAGDIAEVAYYDYVLASTRIKAHYDKGNDGTADALADVTTRMVAWIKVDALTGLTDGSAIGNGVMIDLSGMTRYALEQGTGSAQAIYKTGIVNGKPVARFDGVNDFYAFNDNPFTHLTAAELFIVLKADADPPGSNVGLWRFGSAAGSTHYPGSDGAIDDEAFTDTVKNTGDPTPALTSFRLYNVVSQPGEWTSRIDGTQQFTTATNTFAIRSSQPFLGRSTDSTYFDGDIAEMIVFAAPLSTAERTAVEDYLADKYGLTVA